MVFSLHADLNLVRKCMDGVGGQSTDGDFEDFVAEFSRL
jgi:hypothetical protein